MLDPMRLFPSEPAHARWRRSLYETVRDLPIISPHGHTDPRWFAEDEAFPESGGALHSAGSLHLPHALLAGRLAGVARDSAG